MKLSMGCTLALLVVGLLFNEGVLADGGCKPQTNYIDSVGGYNQHYVWNHLDQLGSIDLIQKIKGFTVYKYDVMIDDEQRGRAYTSVEFTYQMKDGAVQTLRAGRRSGGSEEMSVELDDDEYLTGIDYTTNTDSNILFMKFTTTKGVYQTQRRNVQGIAESYDVSLGRDSRSTIKSFVYWHPHGTNKFHLKAHTTRNELISRQLNEIRGQPSPSSVEVSSAGIIKSKPIMNCGGRSAITSTETLSESKGWREKTSVSWEWQTEQELGVETSFSGFTFRHDYASVNGPVTASFNIGQTFSESLTNESEETGSTEVTKSLEVRVQPHSGVLLELSTARLSYTFDWEGSVLCNYSFQEAPEEGGFITGSIEGTQYAASGEVRTSYLECPSDGITPTDQRPAPPITDPKRCNGKGCSRRRLLLTGRTLDPADDAYNNYLKTCGAQDYDVALYVDSDAHLFAVGFPSKSAIALGCPVLATHAVVLGEDDQALYNKEVLAWENIEEGVSNFEQAGLLPIGTFQVSELHRAYEVVDPSAKNGGLYDIVSNNCGSFLVNLAKELGLKVDGNVTSFVARRLLNSSVNNLGNQIRKSLNYLSLFKGRSLRGPKNPSDEELVALLVDDGAKNLL